MASSIYSYVPSIDISGESGSYDWSYTSRGSRGVEVQLGKLLSISYQGDLRKTGVWRTIYRCGGYTGDARTENWQPYNVSCVNALAEKLSSLSGRLQIELIEPLKKLGSQFGSQYKERVEKAVENVLGKNEAEAFKKGHETYRIGFIRFPSDSETDELKELDRQGALLMGTEGVIPPKYIFHFENQTPLKIHEPFLKNLAKREGKETSSFVLLTQTAGKADLGAEGIDYNAFKALVTYIYTGKIECNAEVLPGFYLLAKQFDMPKLAQKIEGLNAYRGQCLLNTIQGNEGAEKKLASLQERLVVPFSKEGDPIVAFRDRVETLVPQLEEIAAVCDGGVEALIPEIDSCMRSSFSLIAENFAACEAGSYTLAGWKKKYSLPDLGEFSDKKVTIRPASQNNAIVEINRQGEALCGSALYEPDLVLEIDGHRVSMHSAFCKEVLNAREGENYLTTRLGFSMGDDPNVCKVASCLRGASSSEELDPAEKSMAEELISEEVVKGLVDYLYKGEINTSIKNLPALYYLADVLLFSNLKKEIQTRMYQYPESVKNVLEKGIALRKVLIEANSASGETATKRVQNAFRKVLDPIVRVHQNMAAPLFSIF